MRVGLNPQKDKIKKRSIYNHQVVVPVYIPNHNDYFKDSFKIFKICIESLIKTVHSNTFITIVNNGSDKSITDYLDELFECSKIQEVIHTQNIGKLNAILKGLVGNNIELVTIADSDVLFLPNWQSETTKLFKIFPKAGVVGIVPQFKMYESYCGNVIFENLLNKHLKFIPIKNPNALIKFYDSIGWKRDYNPNYLKYTLGLEINNEKCFIGSGHFVATYKKDIFKEIVTNFDYVLGGDSERYLDIAPLKKGYWRLTTYDNFAYHMGNTFEDWMEEVDFKKNIESSHKINFKSRSSTNKLVYYFKNHIFIRFMSIKWLNKIFLKWKKLPKNLITNY